MSAKHLLLPQAEKIKFQNMWNDASKSMSEICSTFKIPPHVASARSKYFRTHGMKLLDRSSGGTQHALPALTPIQVTKFTSLWNNPRNSLEDIGKEFGIDRQCVYRRFYKLRAEGIKLIDRSSNRLINKFMDIEDEFVKLWEARVPTVELCKRFGMSSSQIDRYLAALRYKRGIKLSNRNVERKFRSKLNPAKNEVHRTLSQSVNTDALSPVARTVLELLNKEAYSLGKLSDLVDRSKNTVEKAIRELYDQGFDVAFHEDTKQMVLEKEPGRVFKPLVIPFEKNSIKFGLISDTHSGSKFQQPSLLRTAYQEMEKQKVHFCLHTGDVTEGQRMYRGQEYEVFLHGADEQRDYAAEVYFPKAPFKTYLISGNHDDSFKTAAGHNVIRALCSMRSDLIYRGELQASITIGKTNIYLLHPAGGVAYARSYKLQKIAESITAAGLEKARELKSALSLPQAIFMGHWHVQHYFSYQGMIVGANPCFQAQTPFLKRLGLSPDVGFSIMEVFFDDNQNVVKWIPQYYNLGAYVKERDY